MELDRIFTLSPDVIAVADFDGRFTRLNPAAEQVLGYTQEELLTHPYLDFVHPDDRERTAAEAAAIEEGEPTLSFENRYVRKDGSTRMLEWTSTPVVKDRAMYAVARDVTERRQAEAELARLAGEQAALRRVATLVARDVPATEVFSAVAEEVERLLGAQSTTIRRLEPDGTTVIVASSGNETGIRRDVGGADHGRGVGLGLDRRRNAARAVPSRCRAAHSGVQRARRHCDRQCGEPLRVHRVQGACRRGLRRDSPADRARPARRRAAAPRSYRDHPQAGSSGASEGR